MVLIHVAIFKICIDDDALPNKILFGAIATDLERFYI